MIINAHDHLSHYPSLEKALADFEVLNMTTLAVSESVSDYQSIPDHPLILKGFGIHPWKVTPTTSLDNIEPYIQDCDFIGEIGLDFHWAEDTTAYPRQLEVFEYFLAEAKKHQKICNIHTKGAEKEVLALLQKHQLHGQIIHWYSGPLDLVTDYLKLGCFFTISVDAGHSTLTDQLINLIPTQQLLFETDGPTALEWVNGTPSWPDEILRIQAYVAQLKSCSLTELEVGGHLLMEQLK